MSWPDWPDRPHWKNKPFLNAPAERVWPVWTRVAQAECSPPAGVSKGSHRTPSEPKCRATPTIKATSENASVAKSSGAASARDPADALRHAPADFSHLVPRPRPRASPRPSKKCTAGQPMSGEEMASSFPLDRGVKDVTQIWLDGLNAIVAPLPIEIAQSLPYVGNSDWKHVPRGRRLPRIPRRRQAPRRQPPRDRKISRSLRPRRLRALPRRLHQGLRDAPSQRAKHPHRRPAVAIRN